MASNFPSTSFKSTCRNQAAKSRENLQSSSSSSSSYNQSSSCSSSSYNYHESELGGNFQQEEKDLEYTRIRREYRAIRKNCLDIGIKYTDKEFPATEASLIGGKTTRKDGEKLKNFQSVTKWLRPEGITLTGAGNDKSGKDWVLMKTPHPNDIRQGYLGNCWFIAALALIAERTDLLSKIFVSRKFNNAGVYALRLFKDGQWKGVVIDDLFPCDTYDRLIFSRCRGKQLWVPLIEKAMSKLFGGYAALQSGHVSDGLNYLTGFVTERIDFRKENDHELLWARLLSFHSAAFVMGTAISTSDQSQAKMYKEKMGLVANHGYSVLQVVCMENNRLIQLRNPWGSFSWKGDWSDESPLWTEVMSAYLSPHRSKEGIFWMSYQDFLNIFTELEVCKIRQDWHIYSLDGILPPYADPDCQPCFELVCEESCEVDISLYQASKRSAKETVQQTDIGLMIFQTKKSSKGFRLVKPVELTLRCVQRAVSCHLLLTAGNYCLVPFSLGHWTERENEETFYTFGLTIHSSRELQKFVAVSPPNILADALICCGKYFGDRQHFSSGEDISTISLQLGCGYCIILENKTKDKYVELECKCTTNGNYVSTRNALSTRDKIPPSHCQVFQMFTVKDISKASSSKYSFSAKITNGFSKLTLDDNSGDLAHQPPISERIIGLHGPRRYRK